MTSYPLDDEELGNQHRVPLGTKAGDFEIDGDLTIHGSSLFEGPVRLLSNLTIASTSIVDVYDGLVYDFGDPIFYLNSQWSAPTDIYIPEAGLRIFRGDFFDTAQLMFTENAARTTLEWKIGLGADMKRIGRVEDTMSDRHAMYWDASMGALSRGGITTHSGIVFNANEIVTSIPYQSNIPSGGAASFFVYNQVLDPVFSFDRKSAGITEAGVRIGFKDYTYDGNAFTGLGVVTGEDGLLFSSAGTPHDRARFIFEDCASIGVDGAGVALFRTDLSRLRTEGATSVGLRAGTSGTDQLLVTATSVQLAVDLDLDTHAITAREMIAAGLSTESMNYAIQDGTEPIPLVAGWPGTITNDGITVTETWEEVQQLTKYEVKLAYTVAAGAGEDFTIYAPIYLGTDLDNVRSIHGVSREMSGVSVVRVYSIPQGAISIEPPFQLDPTWLTFPGNLDDYHILSVNAKKVTGDWEIIITVETRLPGLVVP